MRWERCELLIRNSQSYCKCGCIFRHTPENSIKVIVWNFLLDIYTREYHWSFISFGLHLFSSWATYRHCSRQGWWIIQSQRRKSRFYCLGQSSLGLVFYHITCKALWNLQTLKRLENQILQWNTWPNITNFWTFIYRSIWTVYVSLSCVIKYTFATERRTPATIEIGIT
jgi:hypothetical protein